MLKLYSIPGVAQAISDYLDVRDEMALDCTCSLIHEANREHVYPYYDIMDLDHVAGRYSDTILRAYLRKLAPYIREITSEYNPRMLLLPLIQKLPKLETLRYAVPLIMDVSMRRIHPDTFRFWVNLRSFINSVCNVPNQLKKIDIVPGQVMLVHTNPGEDEYFDEMVLRDNTEGSHMHAFRYFQMPVVMIVDYPNLLTAELRAPKQIMDLTSKKIVHTDWSNEPCGVLSRMLELV
jgi:hypothetical protein